MRTTLRAIALNSLFFACFSVFPASAAVSSASNSLSEEQWVMSVYQKGKENYDRGDYAAATAEWDKISEAAGRYPAFKTVIDYLRGRTKNIPPESADRVEQQLAARKKQIEAAFQKGKEFYDQGKMTEALGEWDQLASYLPEEAPQRRLIEDLRKYYVQSQQAVPSDGLTKETSDDMQRFFSAATELFKKQAEQANVALETSDSAPQNIDAAYSKAKLLYYQGNYADAMKEIGKLASYLSEGSADRKSAESLMRVYQQSLAEKGSAERGLEQKNVKMNMPTDFQKFASEVDEKFRAELKDLETRRRAFEKSLRDKQAWSSEDFHKGADLYRQGKTEEAVRQWERVASEFENERSILALIDTVKKNQAERARIQKDLEKALAEKETLVKNSLEKGRIQYEAGNFEEAKREWESVRGLVDNGEKLDGFIAQMRQAYQDSLEVKKAEEEARVAANARVKTPESLVSTLASERKKLEARTQTALAQKQKADGLFQERRAMLAKTTASGKALLDSGKYPEALAEWATLLPIVDDEAGWMRALDGLRSDHDAAQKAESDAKIAETKKDAKVPLSDDLSALLAEAGRQIRAQNDAASSRKKQAEQSLVDRQVFVSEHFEKGKAYYDDNKFSDALKEWALILPNLEEEAKLKPLFDQALADREKLASSQKAALDAEARKDQKVGMPGDLFKLIDATRAQVLADTHSAVARAEAADRSDASRQALVKNTFEKGKTAYEEGRYSEAIKEWNAIVDEFDEADKLRASMKGIDESYERLVAAKKNANEADARKSAKLSDSAALSSLLNEIRQKMQTQIEAQKARKETAEKALAERRARLDAVIAKGKLAFEAGKTEEALQEWTSILPEFEEEQSLRQSIEALQANQALQGKAMEEAESAEKRRASRVAAPPELEKILAEFLASVKGETETARSRRQAYDAEFEDRKTLVRNTYLKGLALFDENKYPEALAEWSILLPQIENEPQLEELLDKANHDFQNLALAQKAVADAESRGGKKLKAPEELAARMKTAVEKVKLQSADRFSEILEQERQTVNIEKESSALEAKKFKTPSDITAELADARKKLKERTTEAEAKRNLALKALQERQAALQTEFDKGKKLYWEGKLDDAIQIWSAIAPQLEDEDLRRQIAEASQRVDDLRSMQKETQEAELRKDNKLKAPAELPKLLENMNQIVQSQAQYADTQKKIADQTFVDRQALINTTFQKGKNLYEQDRISEALEEWASISPYLERGSELKEFIDGVARHYQESQIAKRAADEAQLKKMIKFQTPPDLSKYLAEASDKMKAQTEDSEMQKEAADRSRAERQVWVDGKFEHGKLLYQKGDVAGAVDEWKTILPYIEDDSKVRQLILKAEENKQALLDQTAKAAVTPPAPPKIAIPPDLGKALAAANADLEKSLAKKNSEKLESDVLDVIQEKKKKSKKETPKKPAVVSLRPVDEIEQMMLEYNIATPQELEKRHQEMKAMK